MEVTIETIVNRWANLERPLFKGKLIDADGCKCAQGDVLACAGYSDDELRAMAQSKADTETARVLGISRTHAVLLRNVNDRADGAPQVVLTHPEDVLGDKAPLVLAFWYHLDKMDDSVRYAVGEAVGKAALNAVGKAAWDAAWDAAKSAAKSAAGNDGGDAAWDAAREAAWNASWDAAWKAAWDAAWDAAWGSTAEIQGMDILERDGRQPYCLAFFGFDTWEKVRALCA